MKFNHYRWDLADGFEDPLATLRNEINRLFDSPWEASTPHSGLYGGWTPALDVYENTDNLIVTVELPGMKTEDIEISVHDGSLTVSGERKLAEKAEAAEASRTERYFGRFQRTVSLSKPVDVNKVNAIYRNGILTITLPKTEEAKPKQIEVKAS